MTADFFKSSFEQFVSKMLLTKERHITDLYRNLMSLLPQSEIDRSEIERIINNYEAICGSYVRKSRKQILRSLNYFNRRVYRSMKAEIFRFNERLEEISRKMDRLEGLLK
jgi:hypothetical protein